MFHIGGDLLLLSFLPLLPKLVSMDVSTMPSFEPSSLKFSTGVRIDFSPKHCIKSNTPVKNMYTPVMLYFYFNVEECCIVSKHHHIFLQQQVKTNELL